MSESSLIFSRCKRCSRSLRNPKSQKLGYGKICFEKHKAEAEQALKNGIARGKDGQESLFSYTF
jgi:hypothetical protein